MTDIDLAQSQIDLAAEMGVELYADGPRLIVIGERASEYCHACIGRLKEPLVNRLRQMGRILPPPGGERTA